MSCDPSLLLCLPDDLFGIVSRFLLPRDVCNLSICCKSLHAVASSEKVWLTQCDKVGVVPLVDLVLWREGVSSYKALCCFLLRVKPLLGIWVHQNPELGNLVYVMPGFVSVVGCRIIPQELGHLGIQDGPIQWSSVFEVIGDFNGSTIFFLHGREEETDYVHPGSVKYIEESCNVLLLEIEAREQDYGGSSSSSRNCSSAMLQTGSLHDSGAMISGKACRSSSEISRLQREGGNAEATVPFSKLCFSDRRKLLEVTGGLVRQEVPGMAAGPLFPAVRDDCDNFQKDLVLLKERRAILCQMCNHGSGRIDNEESSQGAESPLQLEQDDIRKSCNWSKDLSDLLNKENGRIQCTKKKSLGGYFWGGFKQILRKSNSVNESYAIFDKFTSRREMKHARLEDFLRSSNEIGLTLKASTVKLSSYRAWPNMPDSWFALFKMPLQVPSADQIFAGLWGGTFGWPPGKPSQDKPGKALFFVLLSYEESQEQKLLIATKILEGSHYVLHPNGSAMFIVDINDPSSDSFPFDSNRDTLSVEIKHAFTGEGISNGYGFRYPGSKPGSLFVFENGILAFVWKDTKVVLTLQRLDLQQLLKKGERVPSLPPISNFSYLTKSYSNVFTGFPSSSTSSPSPR
ncbi:F-box protein At5g39450 [Vigna radiata var. radiata]|uniref:F-box protein At5g39450 n=1 Tax=Vigna radiata var. radiata TaxID=3916 RepID=A0A1S3W0J4_VIGRR|nr:F-box protein At5g39450 [Vigna radiata var. radiata]